MKIPKSNVNAGRLEVTVFARFPEGKHMAETMIHENVGHPRCFANSVDEVTTRIVPGPRQIEKIVQALDSGLLTIAALRDDYFTKGEHGGYAILDI